MISIIKYELGRLPHLGDILPKEWGEIRNNLENLSDNFIKYSTYLEICNSHSLARDKANFLCKYFHDLGVFLHFGDNSILKKTLFLKPEWATNAVYKIIDTREVQINKGKFKYNDLYEIWDEYPEDRFFHLLELMKRFELCFQIPNSENYIVPNMLPPKKPFYAWDKKFNLKFEYHYDFMPAGILSRFIVRLNDLIKDEIYWKNGVVISRESVDAEVIAYPFEKKIRLRLKGKNKKDLLSIIRREIDHIHKSQNYPSVQEMIPCNCKECKKTTEPNLHSYTKLANALYKNKKNIECSISFDKVNVKELLGGIGIKQKSFENSRFKQLDNSFKNVTTMKIGTQNFYGGNQQFADTIINNATNKLDESERNLINLISDNSSSEEEKTQLLESLSDLKDEGKSPEEKQKAKSMLDSFLNSGVNEAGKQIVRELIENGSDYLSILF